MARTSIVRLGEKVVLVCTPQGNEKESESFFRACALNRSFLFSVPVSKGVRTP